MKNKNKTIIKAPINSRFLAVQNKSAYSRKGLNDP